MKCPHCGFNLPNIALKISDDVKSRAMELRKQGKSLREIKLLLDSKISLASICRITNAKYKSRSKFYGTI